MFNPGRERDGFESPYTVIQIVSDDMPFIVDSVTMELGSQDQAIELAIHPVIWVRRDDVDVVSVGELQNIGDKFDGIATQMLMEVYKDRAEEPAPAVKGTTETQVVGSEVKAGSPGSQTTTVKEFPATKGRPTVRPSPQSPPPKCTNL